MTHTYTCEDCGETLHADTSADEYDTLDEILAANGWRSAVEWRHDAYITVYLCESHASDLES